MPQQIAIHGVLIPAAAGGALLLLLLLIDAVLRILAGRRAGGGGGGAARKFLSWLEVRASGWLAIVPAMALVFILSFHARQGLRWPPPTAWEWFAPAVAAIALVAWFMPGWLAAAGAGAITGWALLVPGLRDTNSRIGIGVCVLLLALVLVFLWRKGGAERHSRTSRALACLTVAVPFAGLAGVVIASGFEKLTTNTAALALFAVVAALLSLIFASVRASSALAPLVAALLVGIAVIGAGYGPEDFPFWHWPVAVAAPLAALVAEVPPDLWKRRPPLAAVVRLGAVSLVAFGNAGAALAPLIARGDFPPP